MEKSILGDDIVKYGADKLRRIVVNINGEGLEVIVRVPDRVVIGEFEKYIDRDPAKARAILVNACVLTEKERVNGDDELYYGVANAVCELFPKCKATIMAF